MAAHLTGREGKIASVLSVVLALGDTSCRDATTSRLEDQGHTVAWVAPRHPVPPHDLGSVDVACVDAAACEGSLFDACAEWLVRTPRPELLVLGGGSAASPLSRFGARLVGAAPDPERLAADIERHGQHMSVLGIHPRSALEVMGLVAGGERDEDAAAIVAGAKHVSNEVVLRQLHPLVHRYVAGTTLLGPLLHRNLMTPEQKRFVMTLDGARTIRGAMASGAIDSLGAARLLWALVAGGALRATLEPPARTPSVRARLVALARKHLGARVQKIKKARHHYDVLDIPHGSVGPVAHRAAQLLATRFSPEVLGPMDLGDLARAARPVWDQILTARRVLTSPAVRRRYEQELARVRPEIAAQSAKERVASDEAEAYFMRGQEHLARGDARRAMADLARAARRVDDNPDYEAYAAWARFLAEDAVGIRRRLLALREAALAERSVMGRRPRPRALLALGLLREAAGDVQAAREAFEDALVFRPNLAPARAALERLA